MEKLSRCLVVALSLMTPFNVLAAVLMQDGFETGDLAQTNDEGFSWSSVNRTSVVTMNPECGGLPPGTPTTVYNGAVVCIGPQTPAVNGDWYAKNGNYSLRFRYPAGVEMSEQRFALGKNYHEIWLSYWIRVPTNFTYPSNGKNNKFLSLWVGSGGYDNQGTVTWQLRPNGSGANVVYQDGGVNGGEVGSTPFFTTDDRGRWMQVVYQVVAASSSTSNNGIIRMYRKWDEATNYTLIHEKTNANTYNPAEATQGISHGYIMGWANVPYTAETEFLVDDFTVSTTSLLDVGTNARRLSLGGRPIKLVEPGP